MWPNNVGIHALELVYPIHYVDQAEMENYDQVSSGKYTIGLGQRRMAVCTDREDVTSLCLTAVHRLLQNYNIEIPEIGHLQVGTETLIDNSKSVKSELMQLFEPYGVTDLEGVDAKNACYGATAAVFNAINWIESSSWNGRYALVVAADIAVYAEGAARPTGGAGAVAILIGANAPLIFERGTRATNMRHRYDFYKPQMDSLYPLVDGKLSIECYLSALDTCYQLFCKKSAKYNKTVGLETFDAMVFHSPYCKLVQKSFARLVLNDFVRDSSKFPAMNQFLNIDLEQTYFDKEIEKAFLIASDEEFKQKTLPSLFIASELGNMYTASVYGGLISVLISKSIEQLCGMKIGMFSYGSGSAATMFAIKVTDNIDDLQKLKSHFASLPKDLVNKRIKVHPEYFNRLVSDLENNHKRKPPLKPEFPIESFWPATYYLVEIDGLYRRTYKLKIADDYKANGNSNGNGNGYYHQNGHCIVNGKY